MALLQDYIISFVIRDALDKMSIPVKVVTELVSSASTNLLMFHFSIHLLFLPSKIRLDCIMTYALWWLALVLIQAVLLSFKTCNYVCGLGGEWAPETEVIVLALLSANPDYLGKR